MSGLDLAPECKRTHSDAGTYWCIPTPKWDDGARGGSLHVLDYDVPDSVPAGKTVFFKLDASGFSSGAFPLGLSLFVHLNTKNCFDATLDAEQLFLATQASKGEAVLERRYVRKGVYTLQLAPREFEPTVYYFEFRNLMGRDVVFTMLFQLDVPEQKFLDSPTTIELRQAEGDKMLYYYVDMKGARADKPGAKPQFVEAHILTDVPRLADECAATQDFLEQHDCEKFLLGEANLHFWGTTLPACVAHDELRRGVARDCWSAAVEVGRLAASTSRGSVYRAYAMCPDGLCNDGCREGVLQAWVGMHWSDHKTTADGQPKVIGVEAKTICRELGDVTESCYGGLGAGLFTVEANRAAKAGAKAATAFRAVAAHCAEISAHLDDATRATAADWCVDGAFRHFAGAVTANCTDATYPATFVSLCDPAAIGDAALQLKCHTALGFSAAYRARGDLVTAQQTCGRLFASSEAQATAMGGRDDCLRSVAAYLNAEKLHKESVATCPVDNLYSVVLYNLAPTYTSPPGVDDSGVVIRTLEWLNGSALWDGATCNDSADLWWFAVDANQASAKMVLTVHSRDPRIPLTTLAPAAGAKATAAATKADDVAAARTNAAVALAVQQTTRQLTGVYAGVTFAFVCLKLLLLVWLRKKLRGSSFYGVITSAP